MQKFRLDDLNLDGLKIYQIENGYHFTSDSVVLSNFVKASKKDCCLEIGSGSGVISILVNYKNKPQKIVCFEIQKDYASLTQKNIELNNMQDKISVVCDDINNYKNYDYKFDVAYSNPPYFREGVCKKSEQKDIAICKHEKFLPLENLFCAVKNLVKFGGKFYFVYPADRIDEIFVLSNKHNLQVKRMFFCQPTLNKNANTVYVETVVGGKSGVSVLPTLVSNTLDGNYVQTIQKLYRDVKE